MKRLIAAAALAACLPAHADLVDVAGANYSFDNGTGLYWLDPNATVRRSVNDVAESDFAMQGWRYATKAELGSLFSQEISQQQYADEIESLATRMGGWTGVRYDRQFEQFLHGIYDVGGGQFGVGKLFAGVSDSRGATLNEWDVALPRERLIYDISFPESGYEVAGGGGSFLVSAVAPVPEPSTYAMFGIGLVGLWLAKRRKA